MSETIVDKVRGIETKPLTIASFAEFNWHLENYLFSGFFKIYRKERMKDNYNSRPTEYSPELDYLIRTSIGSEIIDEQEKTVSRTAYVKMEKHNFVWTAERSSDWNNRVSHHFGFEESRGLYVISKEPKAPQNASVQSMILLERRG